MASYGTNEAFVAYLTATGRALPDGADPDVLRLDGTLWVDQWETRYRSAPLTVDNSFPRVAWPAVPTRVEQAAYEAAWAVSQGVDIWGAPSSAGVGNVVREKVDVLELQYSGPQASNAWDFYDYARVMLPRAYALLVPFFKRNDAYGAAFVV